MRFHLRSSGRDPLKRTLTRGSSEQIPLPDKDTSDNGSLGSDYSPDQMLHNPSDSRFLVLMNSILLI